MTDPPFFVGTSHQSTRHKGRNWSGLSIYAGWWNRVCHGVARHLEHQAMVRYFESLTAYPSVNGILCWRKWNVCIKTSSRLTRKSHLIHLYQMGSDALRKTYPGNSYACYNAGLRQRKKHKNAFIYRITSREMLEDLVTHPETRMPHSSLLRATFILQP